MLELTRYTVTVSADATAQKRSTMRLRLRYSGQLPTSRVILNILPFVDTLGAHG